MIYSLSGKIVDEKDLQPIKCKNIVTIKIDGEKVYTFATGNDGNFIENNNKLKIVYERPQESITVNVKGYKNSTIDRFETSTGQTAGGNPVSKIMMFIIVSI